MLERRLLTTGEGGEARGREGGRGLVYFPNYRVAEIKSTKEIFLAKQSIKRVTFTLNLVSF